MSRLLVCIVDKSGDVRPHEEYGNSWGGAAYIWSALSRKYLGSSAEWILGKIGDLWALQKDARLEVCERVALIMTFDGCIVRKENLTRLADHLHAFQCWQLPMEPNACCHIDVLADDLIDLQKREDVAGVCFYWTTVAPYPWDVCSKHGYDQECDKMCDAEQIPYNINKGIKHWWLFDEPALKGI